MPEISAVSRPFKEAVDYFRNKVNLPTKTYRDIQRGTHTKAFVVAGATKEDLLADFRAAIDKAISRGTSLQDFKKDFDNIVKQHGWSYKGSRGWRSKTIYATNIQTAYAAGRYKQMTDPDVLKRRPYWQYLVGDSKKHRKEHLKLNGLILPANDPFWKTHYPPNGWGCKCRVRSLSENDLKRMGRKPDKAPQGSSDVHPDWRYNIGEAAYGNPFAKEVFSKEWENISIVESAAYKEKNEPLPLRLSDKKLLSENLSSPSDVKKEIEKVLNGENLIKDPNGANVYIDIERLSRHIFNGNHSREIPFMKELINDPEEIWAFFEKLSNGKYRIRKSYVKQILTDKGRPVCLLAEGEKGVFKGITSYIKPNINKLRKGILLYQKKQG